MLRCRIFNKHGEEIESFSPSKARWGESISVGRSSRCAVSLKHHTGVDRSVSRVHFSVVKRGQAWYLVPGSKNAALRVEGSEAEQAKLEHGLFVEFGCCSLRVDQEREDSTYALLWKEDGELKSAQLTEGASVVGTGKGCNVNVTDRTCSRRHARIDIDGKTIHLEDLDSTNGTQVDGDGIHSRVQIRPHQSIRFGRVPAAIVPRRKVARYRKLDDPFANLAKRKWRKRTVAGLVAAIAMGIALWAYVNDSKPPPQPPPPPPPSPVDWAQVQDQFWLALAGDEGMIQDARDIVIRCQERGVKGLPEETTLDKLETMVAHEDEARIRLNDVRQSLSEIPIESFLDKNDIEGELDYRMQLRERDHSDLAFRKDLTCDDFEKLGKVSLFCTGVEPTGKRVTARIESLECFQTLLEHARNGKWNEIWDLSPTPLITKHTKLKSVFEAIRKLSSLVSEAPAICRAFGESSFAEGREAASTARESVRKIKSELKDVVRVLSANVPHLQETWTTAVSQVMEQCEKILAHCEQICSLWEQYDEWQIFIKQGDVCGLVSALPGQREGFDNLRKKTEGLVTAWSNVEADNGQIFREAKQEIGKALDDFVTKLTSCIRVPEMPSCQDYRQVHQVNLLVMGIGSSNSSQVVVELRKRQKDIEDLINEKCNNLYQNYQDAKRDKNQREKLKALDEILETACPESRWAKWAERQKQDE